MIKRKNKKENYHLISLEEIAEAKLNMPNEFGSFEKAKYVVYKYADVVLYSCVTTCRSEKNMFTLLMEWLYVNCYMKEYPYARIVKFRNGKEKLLFKGNVYGTISREL